MKVKQLKVSNILSLAVPHSTLSNRRADRKSDVSLGGKALYGHRNHREIFVPGLNSIKSYVLVKKNVDLPKLLVNINN